MKRFGYVLLFGIAGLTACGGAANLTPAATGWLGRQSGVGPLSREPGAGPQARERVLYEFMGAPDASGPFGGLLAGKDGEFFGISNGGGTSSDGTVYEISAKGQEQVLHDFQGGNDGAGSEAALVMDRAGNLFGTTDYGGGSNACSGGCGTVFELQRNGSGYTERVLHAFSGGEDGEAPLDALILDKHGVLYGTTFFGGTGPCTGETSIGYTGCGTVFRMTPSGSQYNEATMYSFQAGRDGALPGTAVIADSSGNLYGTTEFGGNTNSPCRTAPIGGASCGTVFKITPSGTESVLYRFKGGKHDGSGPRAPLRELSNGSFAGVTLDGGGTGVGGGTVFELTPNGGKYAERIIHFFGRHSGDGLKPQDTGGLLSDSNGDLYGTTNNSNLSPCGCGTVFELVPNGSGYSEKIIHFFYGFDGAFPRSGVILHGGMLYGTTFNGGGYCYGSSYSCGVVYKLK